VLEDEAEFFDCEGCAVARAQRDLGPENAEAWRLFNLCGSRVSMQWQLGGWILQRTCERWSLDDTTDMVERLDIILAELAPPKAAAE